MMIDNERTPLSPGMTVTVEIATGSQRSPRIRLFAAAGNRVRRAERKVRGPARSRRTMQWMR